MVVTPKEICSADVTVTTYAPYTCLMPLPMWTAGHRIGSSGRERESIELRWRYNRGRQPKYMPASPEASVLLASASGKTYGVAELADEPMALHYAQDLEPTPVLLFLGCE